MYSVLHVFGSGGSLLPLSLIGWLSFPVALCLLTTFVQEDRARVAFFPPVSCCRRTKQEEDGEEGFVFASYERLGRWPKRPVGGTVPPAASGDVGGVVGAPHRPRQHCLLRLHHVCQRLPLHPPPRGLRLRLPFPWPIRVRALLHQPAPWSLPLHVSSSLFYHPITGSILLCLVPSL